MDCGIPSIEMHAAKTILRTTTKASEIAELKKLVQELQQAAIRQTKQVTSLQRDSDELHTLKTELKKGTLTRPKWVTPDDWSKFISNNEEDNGIIVKYVRNHPGTLSFPDDGDY
jgi:predicted RNase H-like nuclease (RuvC/YqgF family)